MNNVDVSVFDCNLRDHERLKDISKAIEVVTKGKVPYVESNDRCQICDRPCVGKYCDYHKELIRNGDI